LLAQADGADQESSHLNGKYLGKMAVDFGKVVASPLHWTGKDLLIFGAAAGTTAVFFGLDRGIQEWVEDNPKISSSKFSLFVTHFGEAPFLLGLSAVLYAGGEAFRNNSLRKTGLLSLESYAINGIIVTVIKFVLGRSRPFSGEGAHTFNWFSWESHEHSFPSGHSSSAFAVASVIAGQSPSAVVGALSYSLAALVALSRVNNNEHWASDVVAGSLLGYFIGKAVLALNRPFPKDKPTLSFAPGPRGFSLALRF
ncbi:MAG: phosphatase PAP2 family protein, partial [Candidatus Aminicenantes bacterium]|nr:phosphatase PAP2 family protein [Candidatus Aminicenantes bacterium]